jgi:membrane protein
MPPLWTIAKEAALKWSDHRDARQGAALAYYSVFSIGPVIVIAIAIAGLAFGREAVNGEVADSIKGMMGDTGAKAVQAMLADAGRPRQGIVATILGIGALLFAAIGVIVQLKDALNVVWEVKETDNSGVWHFLRSYVVSLAAVLALGFLLLTSMVVTALVAAFAGHAAAYVQEWVLHLLSSLVSFGAVSVLFAMMFKWLPDSPVAWYDVWLGAIVTGLLFEPRKICDRILYRQAGLGIDIRGCGVDRRSPDLGLLLGADRADGRRSHARIRAASRLVTRRK